MGQKKIITAEFKQKSFRAVISTIKPKQNDMAQLNVQPKKKSPVIWIILIIAILAILFFFLRGCNGNGKVSSDRVDSSAVVAKTVTSLDSIDWNAPGTKYDEVTDKTIEVRGNDKYSIYALGENVLFAVDQSTIQSKGQEQLKQIAASLKKRYDGSEIAIYGSTDSTGSASHNKQLGAERAESVKNWLIKQAGISADKISVHSKGQTDPVASNKTAGGRELNRSVQIVALAANK